MTDILLILRGEGTRSLVNDQLFLKTLSDLIHHSKFCLSVCNESILLVATGAINNLPATSNKKAFEWVCSINDHVLWKAEAHWVRARRFYTSSVISTGMDMALSKAVT